MNPFWVHLDRKIEQKLYTANWQYQFETKAKQSVSVLVQGVILDMKGCARFLVSVWGNTVFSTNDFSFIFVDTNWHKDISQVWNMDIGLG